MEQEKNNKKIIIFGLIITIIIAIVGMFVILNMTKNYEYYLKEGNYEEAYEKAKTDEEKQIVIAQNSIDYFNRAIFSKAEILIEQMYLENAWYDVKTNCFILQYRDIDNIKSYKYLNYNEKNKKYTLSASALNDIEIDNIELPRELESSMRESEYGELGIYTLKSMAVEQIEEIMSDENLVRSESIENINNFVKERNFEEIPLLVIE